MGSSSGSLTRASFLALCVLLTNLLTLTHLVAPPPVLAQEGKTAADPAAADPALADPAGVESLNFFLGHWEVDILDGEGRIVGKARTHAYAILDGQAMQDDWRSLNRQGQVIFRGTSIRTYVPSTGKWVIHWVMAATPGYTYIDATWKDGELHGEGRGFDHRGEFQERFLYDAITPTSYSFRLERSYDAGKTWALMNTSRARKVPAHAD